MTQAIAAKEMLSRLGHEVVHVVVGRHESRTLPEWVVEGLDAPVVEVPSFGLSLRNGRDINRLATAWRLISENRSWRTSIHTLREIVRDSQPDILLNFFEPIVGLAQLSRPLPVPVISIAHQHLIGHPAHRAPLTGALEQRALRAFADLVSCRSHKLALSFYPAADRPHVTVCPPLMRQELFDAPSMGGDYFVVYIVNHGFHRIVREWHMRNPTVRLHCFYDRPTAPSVERVSPTLTFHRLNGESFLRLMAGSRGLMTTAGFETVSEAAWLGKPVVVVPVAHHAEQRWNARDARQAGIATVSQRFDLDRLFSLPRESAAVWFRDWVREAPETLSRVVDCVANSGFRSERRFPMAS